MSDRLYDILMQTPLGKRSGTMQIRIADSRVSGMLAIMKHSEPFEGTVDAEGNCTIRGLLVTLLRRIPYTAVGTIRDGALRLSLTGERNTFEIRGTAQHGEVPLR